MGLSQFNLFLERLSEESSQVDDEYQLPIRAAMKVIGGREKPWGPLLIAMLAGDIVFRLKEGKGRLMNRIVVRQDELEKIKTLRFEPCEFSAFAFESWINRRDSEELLNINPRSFGKAIEEGNIKRPSGSQHDRQKILALSKDHISPPEILARWSSEDNRRPQTLLRESHILRRNILGWDRAEAEKILG